MFNNKHNAKTDHIHCYYFQYMVRPPYQNSSDGSRVMGGGQASSCKEGVGRAIHATREGSECRVGMLGGNLSSVVSIT